MNLEQIIIFGATYATYYATPLSRGTFLGWSGRLASLPSTVSSERTNIGIGPLEYILSDKHVRNCFS